MTDQEKAMFAIRVVTFCGLVANAPDDIFPHVRSIQKRYYELKKSNIDSQVAAKQAKAEWLCEFYQQ